MISRVRTLCFASFHHLSIHSKPEQAAFLISNPSKPEQPKICFPNHPISYLREICATNIFIMYHMYHMYLGIQHPNDCCIVIVSISCPGMPAFPTLESIIITPPLWESPRLHAFVSSPPNLIGPSYQLAGMCNRRLTFFPKLLTVNRHIPIFNVLISASTWGKSFS